MQSKNAHSSSFRDPSGYIFTDNNKIKRLINSVYFNQYNALTSSGFFDSLIRNRLLINHKEISKTEDEIIIEPEQIPFITYPYEWSFNMYKEAALLTLKIQKYSLEHGFSLKDASAFNVTFYKGKAVFIDTLSFDFYKENSPWRAYKQFVTHFLGPLLMASYHGSQQLKLLSNFIDGIPVKTVSSMLPSRTKLNPLLYTNIHLLAKLEDKHNEDYEGKTQTATLSKKGQLNIIRSLYDFIKKLELKENSEWGNYYNKTNYTDTAFKRKTELINTWISELKPSRLIDIGGNDGTFVRQIKHKYNESLVCDIDNNAVDFNYKTIKLKEEDRILPFVLDVLNPSAAIGLNNTERASFLERLGSYAPDVTLALALIHHMSLSGNVPFKESAKFFASFSKYLIIEFPKRNDSWVQRLLKAKDDFEDYFSFYTLENFEEAYSELFIVKEKMHIEDSERVMYLFEIKN